jgi:cell division protein FtsQ
VPGDATPAAEARPVPADRDNVLPFRRRRDRTVRPRRRHPLRRLVRPLLLAFAIVGTPAAVVTWFLTSPRFALQQVSIATGERVTEEWVRQSLRPYAGDNLLQLPLDEVARTLEQHPWVASVDARKELPAKLAVNVVERREVALLRDGRELHYLDAGGRTIAPFEPVDGNADLPIVTVGAAGGHPGAATALLGELAGAVPEWYGGLSEIEVLGDEDFRIFTTAVPFPLLVRSGTLEEKARQLEEVLPQILARYGSVAAIDLRFARRIIVQPNAGEGASAPPAPVEMR